MCFSLPSFIALYQTAFQSYRSSSEYGSVYLYEASQIFKDVELGDGGGGNNVGTNSDDGDGLGLITRCIQQMIKCNCSRRFIYIF
jgi:hypothetical protein